MIYVVNNEICIRWLEVIESERGKGYGKRLLFMVAQRHKRDKRITLDDMSDGYRKPGNIYLACGFRYMEEDGPEMESSVSTIKKLIELQKE